MQWTCQIQGLIWQMVMEEQSWVQLLNLESCKYQKKTSCWACLRLLMLHLLHHWSGESLSLFLIDKGRRKASLVWRNCFEWGTFISEGPSWSSSRGGNVGQLEYSVSRQSHGCRFHATFRVKSPCSSAALQASPVVLLSTQQTGWHLEYGFNSLFLHLS